MSVASWGGTRKNLSLSPSLGHQGREIIAIALFLVKISKNFSPSYSKVFFSITVYVSTLQKFQKTLVQCFNE
jgi:hypothetical protein